MELPSLLTYSDLIELSLACGATTTIFRDPDSNGRIHVHGTAEMAHSVRHRLPFLTWEGQRAKSIYGGLMAEVASLIPEGHKKAYRQLRVAGRPFYFWIEAITPMPAEIRLTLAKATPWTGPSMEFRQIDIDVWADQRDGQRRAIMEAADIAAGLPRETASGAPKLRI